MVVVQLKQLECIRTRTGERTEEPVLCIFVEDYEPAHWGPYDMRTGDTLPIDWGDLEGREIRILLTEDDPGNKYDDIIGGVEILEAGGIDVSDYGPGHYTFILPHYEGMHGHGFRERRYKLYLDVLASPDDRLPAPRYCLELVALRCNDAQEYADHVFIKVNGERVWGPRRMRTGNRLSLGSVGSYPISNYTTITLWEEDDHGRNDFFGELMLRIGEDFSFGRDLPHTFSRDRGIVGDARYTLTYRVREC